jgi:hypothetical protein
MQIDKPLEIVAHWQRGCEKFINGNAYLLEGTRQKRVIVSRHHPYGLACIRQPRDCGVKLIPALCPRNVPVNALMHIHVLVIVKPAQQYVFLLKSTLASDTTQLIDYVSGQSPKTRKVRGGRHGNASADKQDQAALFVGFQKIQGDIHPGKVHSVLPNSQNQVVPGSSFQHTVMAMNRRRSLATECSGS